MYVLSLLIICKIVLCYVLIIEKLCINYELVYVWLSDFVYMYLF